MEFDQVVRKRKMVRQYKADKPIPESIVSALIENAHRAPNAGHTQVQEFVIVKNPSTKLKLAEAALGQESVSGAASPFSLEKTSIILFFVVLTLLIGAMANLLLYYSYYFE